MMHEIPQGNWHLALADAIESASDGDTIVVLTDEMKELGERAHERLCPEKKLTFVVREQHA